MIDSDKECKKIYAVEDIQTRGVAIESPNHFSLTKNQHNVHDHISVLVNLKMWKSFC
jgi:hypothetical protein